MAVYDAIIIGAGPAGITAAIYASRKKMSFLLVTKDIGGQTLWSGDIENYTGWQFITGTELVGKFEEHLKHFNIKVKEAEEVTGVYRQDRTFLVETGGGEYRAHTVVVASGTKSRELGVPGEKEFKNRGVQYCATCDAPLFAEKDVAVAGGGNSALEAAIQLVKISKSVCIVNNEGSLHGDSVLLEKLGNAENLRILNNSLIKKISGDSAVKSITVKTGGTEETIPVDGVFVEIGLTPNSGFIDGVEKNERREIIVNCFSETSVPGLFAAGDVTNVPEKQIIIAAGEGAKAGLSAYRYTERMDG